MKKLVLATVIAAASIASAQAAEVITFSKTIATSCDVTMNDNAGEILLGGLPTSLDGADMGKITVTTNATKANVTAAVSNPDFNSIGLVIPVDGDKNPIQSGTATELVGGGELDVALYTAKAESDIPAGNYAATVTLTVACE